MLSRASQRSITARYRVRCLNHLNPNQQLVRYHACDARTWIPRTEQRPRPRITFTVKKHSLSGSSSASTASPLPPTSQVATILSHDLSQTSPDDILSRIHPVTLRTPSEITERDVILLASKGLSIWLSEAEIFLQDVLSKLFQEHQGTAVSQINLLLAVVDRLPAPSYIWRSEEGDRKVLAAQSWKRWAFAAPVNDYGHEGLAYWVESGGRLMRPAYWSEQALRGEIDKIPSTLAKSGAPFDGPAGNLNFRFIDKDDTQSRVAPTTLEVALANTIFTTGTRRILSRSIWKSDAQDDGAQRFRKVSHFDLEHASVELPTGMLTTIASHHVQPVEEPGEKQRKLALVLPLRPLTQPRTISACMGNVIRGLEKSASGASKELEDAVDAYFANKGQRPSAAAVWALVLPKSLSKNVALGEGPLHSPIDNASESLFADNPAVPIWRGARLRKVLSGGGGWGPHAGLLSLDPEVSFTPASSLTKPRNLDEMSVEDLFSKGPTIEDIAKPGDIIQFFIAPNTSSAGDSVIDRDLSRTVFRQLSLDFGVLPNEMDSSSGYESSHSAGGPIVETYTGHFGAMSEGGLALKRQIAGSTRTKINVPFARFKVQRLLRSEKSELAKSKSRDTSSDRKPKPIKRLRNEKVSKMVDTIDIQSPAKPNPLSKEWRGQVQRPLGSQSKVSDIIRYHGKNASLPKDERAFPMLRLTSFRSPRQVRRTLSLKGVKNREDPKRGLRATTQDFTSSRRTKQRLQAWPHAPRPGTSIHIRRHRAGDRPRIRTHGSDDKVRNPAYGLNDEVSVRTYGINDQAKIRKFEVDKSPLFAPMRLRRERRHREAEVRRAQLVRRLESLGSELPRWPSYLSDEAEKTPAKPVQLHKFYLDDHGKDNKINTYLKKAASRRRTAGKLIRTTKSQGPHARSTSRILRSMKSRPVRYRHSDSLLGPPSAPSVSPAHQRLLEMVSRKSEGDMEKLKAIKSWSEARIVGQKANSPLMLDLWDGESEAEDGLAVPSKPRSNKALDDIDMIFKEMSDLKQNDYQDDD